MAQVNQASSSDGPSTPIDTDTESLLVIRMESVETPVETVIPIQDSAVKLELDHNNEYTEFQIKLEADSQDCDNNPFQNIQLQVKDELEAITEKDLNMERCSEQKNGFKDVTCNVQDDLLLVSKTEIHGIADVKEEVMGDDALVSYDYPNFDDGGSMDSNEANALNQVEACLHDDVDIKYEEEHYENDDKVHYSKMDIKEDPELTVTETHLITNKLINTTSTVTNTHDGLIESQTTKTLVMEIHPMTESVAMSLSKMGNPEEILPTTNNKTYMDCQNSFQLNSITGNVLSLEQEAYGLLKAKRKKVTGDKQYPCPKCQKSYSSRSCLAKHLRIHDGIEKRAMGIIKMQKTKSENRYKKMKLEEESIKLEAMKKEGYVCTCGEVYKRRSRMETCLRSHNEYSDTKTYPCVSCSKQFKDKEELSLHRKRLHRKRFPCKFCPTDYHTRKELFKHLQVHQKVQLMEYKVISEVVKGKQKLKCFMCSKSYAELSDLKSHVMDDHKEPYSCPNCKRTFSKIIDFGNHTKVFHPEVEGQSVLDVLEAFSKLVKAWKCEECGLQFHEADKLAVHQIEKHSHEAKIDHQYQCADCRRVFVSQKGLTSHRRIHHSVENAEESEAVEKGVMCLECRKICKDMTALLSHMRFHSPDRKYPCKFCDFRFATPEKRKAHAEIHTGDMKYVCFICEYQCSSENRLKRHKVSLKHVNMREFLLTGKPLVEEQSTSKEKMKDVKKKKKVSESESSSDCCDVSCDICGETFQSQSVMLEHKTTHPFIEFPNDDKPSRIFFK